MTLGECLEWCRSELAGADLSFGHGTDNAHDEAAWLVLSAMGLSPAQAPPDNATEVDVKQQQGIREMLDRRIRTRQPLAYLTGETWFCGMRFEVTPDVLVPRSPIAELIAGQFHPWIEADRIRHALDLGTGCGCIGLAMARQMPWIRLDATDISSAALAVAGRNRAMHGLQEAVELIQSNLFEQLGGRRYDLIVSNPPYVSRAEHAKLPAEYHAEPVSGLVSPGQGLGIVLEILRQAPGFMTARGVLVCEVGRSAAALERMMPKLPLTWLEFEHGGEGVFTIDRTSLLEQREAVEASLERMRNVV
jgi:ribosomal protein L3 glutamine methyltransferase